MSKTTRLSKLKKAVIISVAVILCNIFVIMPIVTVVVYESIFSTRFETEEWLRYSVSDFEGLRSERSDFYSTDGTRLAGYKYSREGNEVKGLVIIAHGLGGGGHNFYMPFIDFFTSNGYKVFAYDAHGNDNSDGESARGLPQGVIDLDSAIEHAKEIEEYKGLPIMLFGHSWGAYSSASVLSMHDDIKAAVIVAGFNESEDLILYEGSQVVGFFAELTVPYVFLYEKLKFGSEYADASALQGMTESNAKILVVHSADDTDVPIKYGYDKFYSELGNNERVEFVRYEDRGHGYVFCSAESRRYREELNEQYVEYVEAHGGKANDEIKQEFMMQYLDKEQCFELDSDLLAKIIALYDGACIS